VEFPDSPRLIEDQGDLVLLQRAALLFGNKIEDRLFFPSSLRPRQRPRHSADDKRDELAASHLPICTRLGRPSEYVASPDPWPRPSGSPQGLSLPRHDGSSGVGV